MTADFEEVKEDLQVECLRWVARPVRRRRQERLRGIGWADREASSWRLLAREDLHNDAGPISPFRAAAPMLEAAHEPAALAVHEAASAVRVLHLLDELKRNVPADVDIHIVINTGVSHKTRPIQAWFAKLPTWHFTPTSAFCLCRVERSIYRPVDRTPNRARYFPLERRFRSRH